MEFWNTRNMLAPPTYTYESNADDIDITHFKSILQDGISFYNDQNLFNIEVALLSRIVYRMKTKFRNSKDFQTLEKVKKDLRIFEEMNISKKLEYLLSILPSFDYHEVVVSLPTKNMIDFVLVQLQGIGKILSRAIDTCKKTVIIYEHRLYLGHFWKLALIGIALVSRIHIFCLNMIKFTCILYLRLLPFSHKLKNVTTNWLPKDYVFPKDLKDWLNVEWSKMEEPIEIVDNEFNMSLIDLVDDSDDDVEFIEINDVNEILEDFRKIRKSQAKLLDFDSVGARRSEHAIDMGEEIIIDEDETDIEMYDGDTLEKTVEISLSNDRMMKPDEVIGEETVEEDDRLGKDEVEICEVISSAEDRNIQNRQQGEEAEVDIGELILSEDEILEDKHQMSESTFSKKGNAKIQRSSSSQVIISSSEDEDDNTSVQFVAETKLKKPCVTSSFIPLEASTPSLIRNVRPVKFRGLKGKKKKNKNNTRDASVGIIPDSSNTSTRRNRILKKKKIKKENQSGLLASVKREPTEDILKKKKIKKEIQSGLLASVKREPTEDIGTKKVPPKKRKK